MILLFFLIQFIVLKTFSGPFSWKFNVPVTDIFLLKRPEQVVFVELSVLSLRLGAVRPPFSGPELRGFRLVQGPSQCQGFGLTREVMKTVTLGCSSLSEHTTGAGKEFVPLLVVVNSARSPAPCANTIGPAAGAGPDRRLLTSQGDWPRVLFIHSAVSLAWLPGAQ